MTPELKPLFGSEDRRHADRPSDWTDSYCIAVLAVGGLLWWWGDVMLGVLLICLTLEWWPRKGGRPSDLADFFNIAVLVVSGLVIWRRGLWWLAIPAIGLALHWGFTKWRKRRSSGHD